VTDFKVADEMFGWADSFQAGTMAEFAKIEQADLAIEPTNVGHLQAAGLPLAGLTHGRHSLNTVMYRLARRSSSKLALEASALGRFRSPSILEHLSQQRASEPSLDFVKDLGADDAIDYHAKRFEDELSDYGVVGSRNPKNGFAQSHRVSGHCATPPGAV